MKNTSTNNVAPVSYTDALLAQGKGTTAKAMFTMAYEWGSRQAVPEKALRVIWPESALADDKVTTYLDSVYFVQYCALQYWQEAGNHATAEEWRTKGMDEWAKILQSVGCDFKRDNSDWIYLVSRATIDGKQDKESTCKVIKPKSKNAFRKCAEMLVGMAINGFVFTNPLESLESIAKTRAEKKKAAEDKKAEKAKAKAHADAKKAVDAAKKKADAAPKAKDAAKPSQPAKKATEKPAAVKPLDKQELKLPEKISA